MKYVTIALADQNNFAILNTLHPPPGQPPSSPLDPPSRPCGRLNRALSLILIIIRSQQSFTRTLQVGIRCHPISSHHRHHYHHHSEVFFVDHHRHEAVITVTTTVASSDGRRVRAVVLVADPRDYLVAASKFIPNILLNNSEGQCMLRG